MSKWILIFFLFFLAGCSTTETFLVGDPTVAAVWPPPPDRPRIKYLRSIRNSDDITVAKGNLGRLLELVAGDSQWKSSFSAPYAVTYDDESLMYIAEPSAGIVYGYDLIHREVTPIIQIGDHPLASPVAVAVDADQNLYVSDSVAAKVYKMEKHSSAVRGLSPPQGFRRPAGIAINSLGEKFVVDVLAQKLYVFDRNDNFVREFPGGVPGDELNAPTHVAVDRRNNVYVTDSLDFMVKVYDHEGSLKRIVGRIGDAPGSFARPKGVAVDSDGNLYVVDGSSDNFQIFDQEGRLLLVIGKSGQGPGQFSLPSGIFIDKADRIFIADTYNHRIQVFQYLKQGVAQ